MKIALSLILAVGLPAGVAFAQTPAAAAPEWPAASHNEWRALNAGITKARNDNDVDGMRC